MKKTSFVLVAFALVAMLFTGCSITSYLNDTTWVNSTTEDGVVMTSTLNFAKGGTGSYSQAASLTAETQAEYEAQGYTQAQINEMLSSGSASGTLTWEASEDTVTVKLEGDDDPYTGTIDKKAKTLTLEDNTVFKKQ